MRKNVGNNSAGGTRPIESIRRRIAAMKLVAQGTLSKRMKICADRTVAALRIHKPDTVPTTSGPVEKRGDT